MKIITTLQRIKRIDNLISRKATGSPQTLANRLEVSERCVFRTINLMKNLGAPIYYCEERNSYCYKENVNFYFGFKKMD